MLPSTKTFNLIKILQHIEGYPSKKLLILLLNPLSKNPGSTSIDIHLDYLASQSYIELIRLPLSSRRFSISIKPLASILALDIFGLFDLDQELIDLLESKRSLLPYIKKPLQVSSVLDQKDHKLRSLPALQSNNQNTLSKQALSNKYDLTSRDFAPSAYDGIGNVSQSLSNIDFAPPSKAGKES